MPLIHTLTRKRFKTVHAVLLFCVGVVLAHILFAPQKETAFQPVTMADLRGVWTTDDSTYQDRFLQFDNGSITFGWGADGVGSYTIDEIDSQPDEKATLVHVRYTDRAATAYQFNFYYVDQDGGLLWMRNQEGVDWIHTTDRPMHAPQFK